MLLSLVFLLHSFGLLKAQDLRSSTKDLGYSPVHGIKGVSGNRYYTYSLDKSYNENNSISIRIFTKLKLKDVSRNPRKVWSTAVVPFVISRKCSGKQKKLVLGAMKRFKAETCVRFTHRKNETTFIMITPGKRCKVVFGKKNVMKWPVDKSCNELDSIHQGLMTILGFNVGKNKRGGKNNSKASKKRDGRLRTNDFIKKNFVKVNYIFGCAKKKSNASRSRGNRRYLQVFAGTNRSQRRKRYVKEPYGSKATTFKDAPVKEYPVQHDTKIEIAKNEVAVTSNNITLRNSKTDVAHVVKNETINSSDALQINDNYTLISGTAEPSYSKATTYGVAENEATVMSNIASRNIETNATQAENNETQISEGAFDDPQSTHNITIVSDIAARTALVDPAKLWSDGVIPYLVAEDKYDLLERSLITEAFTQFDNKTCVKFIPRTNEKSYISISPKKRCSASIGKIEGGVNNVSLSLGCFAAGTILHELMHTLGFIHEQNRVDRDKYVKIVWDNILPVAKLNFRKNTENQVTSFGVPYDYESVMHYGRFDFAVDRKLPTIIPLQEGVKIGQRLGFSEKDLIKINKMFKCEEKDHTESTPFEETTEVNDSGAAVTNTNVTRDNTSNTPINPEAIVTNQAQINEDDIDDSHFNSHLNIAIINGISARTAITDPDKLWSKAVIPYVLAEDKYDSFDKKIIQDAFKEFGDKTCVKFIPRTKENTYIYISDNKSCSTEIGKIKEVNNVSIGTLCNSPGTALHELMHALGFIHEQNRHDRDKYVMVMWDNIRPEAKYNYEKAKENETTSFGLPYDYGSVMHYGMYDFSVDNNKPTLIPLQPGVDIGQRFGFSKLDIIKINKMFKCEKKDGGGKSG